MVFGVAGGSILSLILFCCLGTFCLKRRKRRIHDENMKKLEDSYPMSENLDRRSNIRIGLDPIDHGMSPYETKSSLTRRSSVGLQIAQVRPVHTVPGKGTYARGALMTEQEMALDLESDSNQCINTLMTSSWPKAPTSVPRRPSNSSSSVIKSPASNHTIYTPPPLPPPGVSSPVSPKFSR